MYTDITIILVVKELKYLPAQFQVYPVLYLQFSPICLHLRLKNVGYLQNIYPTYPCCSRVSNTALQFVGHRNNIYIRILLSVKTVTSSVKFNAHILYCRWNHSESTSIMTVTIQIFVLFVSSIKFCAAIGGHTEYQNMQKEEENTKTKTKDVSKYSRLTFTYYQKCYFKCHFTINFPCLSTIFKNLDGIE